MTLHPLAFVDAFAGAGGLSLGLQRAGLEPLFAFDHDARAVETQRANAKYFQHSVEKASIEELLAGRLLKRLSIQPGGLFLLAGGPPCQGFSGQRIGADSDGRNSLVSMFAQLVSEVMPRFFLMENVPGIVGRRGESLFATTVSSLEACGYLTHVGRLDAQDYGVAQRRKRVFLVGERHDGKPPVFKFPEGNPTARLTVRDTIASLPAPPEDGSEHPDVPLHRRDRLSQLNLARLRTLREGQGRQDLPPELLAKCHERDAAAIGHRNVYGRMRWDAVAPTITARFDSFTRGQFGHPEQDRTITLREGALLQSFPADFVFCGTKVEVARQIGNAVPPKLAEALGTAFREAARQL